MPAGGGHRRALRWVAGLAASGLMASALAAAGAVVPARTAATRAAARAAAPRLPAAGDSQLRRCAKWPLTFCGGLAVPLDYSSAASPDIDIGFRWLPATATPPRRTRSWPWRAGLASRPPVPSRLPRDDGLAGADAQPAAGQPARHRQLDPGELSRSRPLVGAAQSGPAFNPLVAACGRQLNHTWRYRGGGWVRLRPVQHRLLRPGYLRVVRALRVGRVDLYGDSRKLVRPGLCLPVPGAAALGHARLHLPGP